MTKGGPLDSTLFYNLYLYFKAFDDYEMGYAFCNGLDSARHYTGGHNTSVQAWQTLGALYRRSPRMIRLSINRALLKKATIYLVLVAIAAVLIIPLIWMLSASLKGNEEIFTIPPTWIPKEIHWENYAEVFNRMPFLTYCGTPHLSPF